MTEDPVTVAPDTLLTDAARLMIDRGVGCLPVLDNGRLVGILTEGDFVRMVVERRENGLGSAVTTASPPFLPPPDGYAGHRLRLTARDKPSGCTTHADCRAAEAARRLEQFGLNRLPEAPLPGVALIFLRQFASPFIYILLMAAVASFALGQVANGVFIIAVLLLNAAIGTVQEYSAQRSAAALRNMVRGEARVLRDGQPMRIDVEQLVPGDLVLLSSGDKVPADLKLEVSQLSGGGRILLTGESLGVTKNASAEVAAAGARWRNG